jgi:hypothetical protein
MSICLKTCFVSILNVALSALAALLGALFGSKKATVHRWVEET